MNKSMQTKPSIVFCHGIWADGSCSNKVISALQAENTNWSHPVWPRRRKASVAAGWREGVHIWNQTGRV